jgi:hypothetical protein
MTEEQPPSVWRVDVQPGAGPDGLPRFGEPRLLATLPAGTLAADALPDRRRFLALVPENSEPGSITVVQNWPAALGRKP